MPPINIAAIEREARQMRAREMQRIQGLVSARLREYGQRLLATAQSGMAAAEKSLRALFSWNPQAHRSH